MTHSSTSNAQPAKPIFNHAYSFGFEVITQQEDCSLVQNKELLTSLLHRAMGAKDLLATCGGCADDTCDGDEERLSEHQRQIAHFGETMFRAPQHIPGRRFFVAKVIERYGDQEVEIRSLFDTTSELSVDDICDKLSPVWKESSEWSEDDRMFTFDCHGHFPVELNPVSQFEFEIMKPHSSLFKELCQRELPQI